MHRALALTLLLTLVACKKDEAKPKPETGDTVPDDPAAGSGSAAAPDPHASHGHGELPVVPPPFDLKTPPADAIKTASGLTYKMIKEGTGKSPTSNDGVKVLYTAWRQDGTTLTTTEPGTTPTEMFLHETAGGFVEGMTLLKEGGKAMFWLPAELAAPNNKQLPEQLAYQVELIAVIPAPATPEGIAKPATDGKKEKSGVIWKKLVTAKGEKPRAWDKISLSYSGWDHEGHLLESTALRGKPVDIPVEKLPAVFAETVPQLAAGERARLWIPEKLLGKAHGDVTDNYLCFDVEVHSVTKLNEPPKAPADVAAPPADALKTPKGVSYVVLKAGPAGGPHPKGTEKVKVDYTGWTTDGKRFDSSIPEGKPREFEVSILIAGWADALLMMSPGDKWRVWIPEELAYKGAPQKPAGMLVFDMELLEIVGDKVQFTPPP